MSAHLVRNRRYFAICLALVSSGACASGDALGLQGPWQVVASSIDGSPQELSLVAQSTIEFNGEHFRTIVISDVGMGTFTVNTASDPHEIDLLFRDGRSRGGYFADCTGWTVIHLPCQSA